MRIRILKSCSGARFSYKQGDVVEVDERRGADLVKCGFAEVVVSKSATTTQADENTSTVSKTEIVDEPVKKTRARKKKAETVGDGE